MKPCVTRERPRVCRSLRSWWVSPRRPSTIWPLGSRMAGRASRRLARFWLSGTPDALHDLLHEVRIGLAGHGHLVAAFLRRPRFDDNAAFLLNDDVNRPALFLVCHASIREALQGFDYDPSLLARAAGRAGVRASGSAQRAARGRGRQHRKQDRAIDGRRGRAGRAGRSVGA